MVYEREAPGVTPWCLACVTRRMGLPSAKRGKTLGEVSF